MVFLEGCGFEWGDLKGEKRKNEGVRGWFLEGWGVVGCGSVGFIRGVRSRISD